MKQNSFFFPLIIYDRDITQNHYDFSPSSLSKFSCVFLDSKGSRNNKGKKRNTHPWLLLCIPLESRKKRRQKNISMAAPRSRRCFLSLLTLFSISLILFSFLLFVYTKPSNKPFIDYKNQFSVSLSFLAPPLSLLEQNNSTNNTLDSVSSPPPMSLLRQNNTTNTTLASISSPPPPLRQSNTTNSTLASVSFTSPLSDQDNQKKSSNPTSKTTFIRVCNPFFSQEKSSVAF